ncbi:MAG: dicarboxylate/amino acid:cation symporter [Phaeodactylibacter sp.]|nr:dicarboxylate/amino acid:cation symporter [Phaeodactylibacter sp.]
MKKPALHWQILIGMGLGVAIGIGLSFLTWGPQFVLNWIKPFGSMFISLLKLIAVPLIIVSLVKGVSDLNDITKFSKIGLRTLALYLLTTVSAVLIGLTLVNLIQPGSHVDLQAIDRLTETFGASANEKIQIAQEPSNRGPLQFLEDLIPQNIFLAASDNRNMLQVIFFAIFFAISLLLIPQSKQQPVKDLIETLNEVVLKMVDLIMLFAPYAVFALIATLAIESTEGNLFSALLGYGLTVLLGLALILVFYLLLVYFFTGKSPRFFLEGMGPAQLVAFSTSSSMATLPVTMERVEEHLGVDQEVTSFVCPIGATVNMDGTSLQQAIAAVFVSQVLGHDLALMDQLTLILTATLASIGAAAVPSAGIIMLVIVLESVGFPSEKLPIALAMILAIDRPLDMCRTIVNVSGDGCVSMLVGKSLGMLQSPRPKEWDDHVDQIQH